MLLAVAGFEFRQQLRSHVFWVVFAISALMVFGSVSVDELRVGLTDAGWRNGGQAVARTYLVWSLFYMFTTAALVADAVLRDDLSGFGPIIRATPVSRTRYRLGRFLGALAAVLACFLSVPVALVAGVHAPWVDPASVGPTDWFGLLFGLLVLGLPNLVVSAGLGFGLATTTGSMMGAFLGAVTMLVAYGLGSAAPATGAAALLEPFGFAAYGRAVAAWTSAERDTAVPWLDGILLANRALWLMLASAAVAWVCLRLEPRPRADAWQENGSEPDASARRAGHGTPVLPRFGARTLLAQLAARTRLEVSQLVLTPAFGVLLLLGFINAAGALWRVGDPRAGPATTAALVIALAGAFQVVPIVVAGFFAGELMWNERERRVHDLVGATPLTGVALVLPKLLALAATLFMLACVAAATAAAIQLARHGAPVDLVGYVSWYVLPAWFDWLLFAVLALFLQVASAGKLAGWGWTVLYLIVALTLQKLGAVDPRYRYGLYPGWPLPGALSGAADVGLYRLYWGAAATLLGVAACCLERRGSPASTGSRLRGLLTALRGITGLIAAAAALTFVVLAAWLVASK